LSSWLATYPRDGFFYGHLSWHLSRKKEGRSFAALPGFRESEEFAAATLLGHKTRAALWRHRPRGRDLLKSFGWGIAALHRLDAATKLPRPRRPPHSIFQFRAR